MRVSPQRFYRGLAQFYPWPAPGNEEISRALSFLGWDFDPSLVTRGSYGAGVLVCVLGLCTIPVVPASLQLAALFGTLAAAFGSMYCVRQFPSAYATARRSRALGAAPDIVTRAALRMRLDPTPERAASFSASTGAGPLADSLATHVRRSRRTTTTALSTFGDEWADLFPSLRRSFSLILAAGAAPETDRERLLERAVSVVLSGASDRMASFAADIRGPATALYAFGVLLPLALIALLPAARTAGLGVTPLSITALYGVFLPCLVLAGATRLLVKRPVAFPPPDVSTDHPAVTDRTGTALGIAAVVSIVSWFVAGLWFPSWAPPVAAVGCGVGSFLWLRSQPIVELYDRSRRAESQLPDALELVGRRVANGQAVEAGMEEAASELDGPMGEILTAAVSRQRQLQIGVGEALTGALTSTPSPRLRGSMALFALAADEGQPAGTALLTLAEHVENLRRIEQEARHDLGNVCRTLMSTGGLFAPMVAGATVAMADNIGQADFLGETTALPWLGALVGWYVLVLAVLLPMLAIGLQRGLDGPLVSYHIGRTLLSATCIYLLTYVLVELLI